MKSLTIHTLVMAVSFALCGTPSMAATELSGQPMNQLQNDTHSVMAPTPSAALYALNGLDAHTLAEQAMTDQELKAVEGGAIFQVYSIGVGWGTVVLEVYQDSSAQTTTMYMK
jgi:hypothetical protein